MNGALVIILAFAYLGLLYGIAYFAEKRSGSTNSWVNNPYAYALSLAVYCTAWTFYGSVGRAADSGIDFITIYLGPIISAPLWWMTLRKVIRISKIHRISSLADFISSRYGKDAWLGALVAFLCFIAVVPYLALQIKAISESFNLLVNFDATEHLQNLEPVRTGLNDNTLYITIFLTIFIILFGTRTIEANKRKEGMVAAIAFESVIKLLTFLFIGIVITYGLFNGFGDLFTQAAASESMRNFFTLNSETGYSDWFFLSLVSSFAIFLLPRQFQVAVIENVDEKHLQKAMWIFPLYLLLINIFVVPIAISGNLLFGEGAVNADSYVLSIPLMNDLNGVATLVFLGGLSAATSMIIVSTIALSTMISNSIVVPFFLWFIKSNESEESNLQQLVLNTRRASIVVILAIAYLYFQILGNNTPLVSIGIVSFIAISQFAPAFFGGIYWKKGTRMGAIMGIITGFVMWFYLLILPELASAGVLPQSINAEGFFGLSWLIPGQSLMIEGLSTHSNAIFISLFVNCVFYGGVSIFGTQKSVEAYQSEMFVDVFKYSKIYENSVIWRGTAYFPDLRSLLIKFLGNKRTTEVLDRYARLNNIDWDTNPNVDSRVITFAERLLSEAIGSASARIMVAKVVQEQDINITEILDILKESQQTLELNRLLKQQSEQLRKTGEDLKDANDRLTKFGELKDEFLYTVTHELRTPLTSIRAMAEIIYDNPELEEEERQRFIKTITTEAERLSRLISNVLDLEKFESGSQQIVLAKNALEEVLKGAVESVQQLMDEREIQFSIHLQENLPELYIDRDRILQVVVNLLSNAIKFCNQQEGVIRLVADMHEDTIRIEVRDNGNGIKQEEANLIFDKFYQVKNQTRKKPEGSGLGLAICKNIIEKHAGQIWVESSEHQGCSFYFTLPISIQQQTQAAEL